MHLGGLALKHICLIDPGITGFTGHYAGYARSIGQELVQRGYHFHVLAHKDASSGLFADMHFEPVFRYGFWHRFLKSPQRSLLLDPLVTSFVFSQDLTRSLQNRVNSDWILFMPTIDHHQMLAWAWWFKRIPTSRMPSVVLLFRYTYFYPGFDYVDLMIQSQWAKPAYWARMAFRLLERTAHGQQLRIVTDSSRLSREYRTLTRLPVEVVPIPHTSDIQPPSALPPDISHRRMRCVFLGDARAEKGFALIAEAIQTLHAQGQLQDFEFVLQSHISHNMHSSMERAKQALNDLQDPCIHLIEKPLSREAYCQIISEADVALFPYSRRIYYARTSGPFTEAVAAGKPVIVTHDTWMSDQIAQTGSGITFRHGEVADLVRGITEMRERYQELATRAREACNAWRAFHNPATFVETLIYGNPT